MSTTPESEMNQGSGQEIEVEVAFAMPGRQFTQRLRLDAGATARDAALASALGQEFPGLAVATAPLGIWGRSVADGQHLRHGDRVEIYRPLLADPRDRRRRLASEGKTMANA